MSAPNGQFWTRYYLESQQRLAARGKGPRRRLQKCATRDCEGAAREERYCASCLTQQAKAEERRAVRLHIPMAEPPKHKTGVLSFRERAEAEARRRYNREYMRRYREEKERMA